MTFAIENLPGAPQLVDSIADKMISLPNGYWTDADAEFNTSATNPKGRVIRYLNGTESLYLCFVVALYGATEKASYSATSHGLIIFVSDTWDAENHCPSGNVQRLHIPLSCRSYFAVTPNSHYEESVSHDLFIWWEDDILTFLIRVSDPDNVGHCNSLFSLERDADKEYDNDKSKFFIFTHARGSAPAGYGSGAGYYTYYYKYASSSTSTFHNCAYGAMATSWTLPNVAHWNAVKGPFCKYVHPFGIEYPTDSMSVAASGRNNFEDGANEVYTLLLVPSKAIKSETGRVYYSFPVAFGDLSMSWRTPIKTFKSFFPVQAGRGLIDGDLINVPVTYNGQAVKTWQYMYKNIIAPNGAVLDIAIKYAEP